MSGRVPVTITTMKLSDARQNFSQILNDVFRGKNRILVEKSGIPVAGIISARDLDRLEYLERNWEQGFEILDEIGEAFKDVPVEEIEREVARALAAVRQQLRAEREQGAQPT